MKQSLYEIGNEYRESWATLEAAAEENGGEVPAELLEAFFKIEGTLEKKALNIAALLKDEYAFGTALKAFAEAKLAPLLADLDRAKAHIALADKLHDYLAQNLPLDFKAEDMQAKIAWQKNGGKRPVVILPEVRPEDFPPAYQKIEVDKEAIRSGLEATLAETEGAEAPEKTGQPLVLTDDNGKELAHVKPRGVSLRIK